MNEKEQRPDINPCMYGQLIYNKGAKNKQRKRAVSLINGAGKTEQPHAEEWNLSPVLHYTKKSTENGMQTWTQDLKP